MTDGPAGLAPELTVLGLAVLLAVVQFVPFAVMANLELGTRWTAGPRDDDRPRTLSPLAGRLERAFANHIEGLVLFSAAVLLVSASGRESDFTALCAWAYISARVAYVPAYVSGIPYLRSAIWSVGLFATVAMVLAVLMAGGAP